VPWVAIFEDEALSETFTRAADKHRARWNDEYNIVERILTDEFISTATAFARAPETYVVLDKATQEGLRAIKAKDANFRIFNVLTALSDLDHLDRSLAQKRLEMWLRIHLCGCVDRALYGIPNTLCVREESAGRTSAKSGTRKVPDLLLRQQPILGEEKFLIGEEKRCGAPDSNLAIRCVQLSTSLLCSALLAICKSLSPL
jgi:hypothetical protein